MSLQCLWNNMSGMSDDDTPTAQRVDTSLLCERGRENVNVKINPV